MSIAAMMPLWYLEEWLKSQERFGMVYDVQQ
jgi:hypothetical protein